MCVLVINKITTLRNQYSQPTLFKNCGEANGYFHAKDDVIGSIPIFGTPQISSIGRARQNNVANFPSFVFYCRVAQTGLEHSPDKRGVVDSNSTVATKSLVLCAQSYLKEDVQYAGRHACGSVS